MTNITLLIPTCNRPKEIIQKKKYYKDYPLIIGDSSINPIKEAIPFPKEISIFEKMTKMIAYVKTPYVGFCADDDFLLHQAIQDAVLFLEKNSDYSSIGGDVVSFDKTFNLQPMYYFNSSNILDDPSKRVLKQMKNYFPVIWTVFPTSILQAILLSVIENTDDNLFGELLFTFLVLSKGKYHKLDQFMSVRRSGLSSESRPSIKKFKTEKVYNEKYLRFYYYLVGKLGVQSTEPLMEAWEEYLKKFTQKSKKHYLLHRLRLCQHYNTYFRLMNQRIETTTVFNHIFRDLKKW